MRMVERALSVTCRDGGPRLECYTPIAISTDSAVVAKASIWV